MGGTRTLSGGRASQINSAEFEDSVSVFELNLRALLPDLLGDVEEMTVD